MVASNILVKIETIKVTATVATIARTKTTSGESRTPTPINVTTEPARIPATRPAGIVLEGGGFVMIGSMDEVKPPDSS